MRAWVVGGVALAVGLVGAASAADQAAIKPDEIIAARQAGFDLQQGVFAAMKAAVETGGPVKPLSDGAKGLVSWGHVIPSMFPEGTETGHETKAKKEIWTDRAGFEKAAANFTTQAEKLLTLAKADDKAGFAAQFKETGAACDACHRGYRVKTE